MCGFPASHKKYVSHHFTLTTNKKLNSLKKSKILLGYIKEGKIHKTTATKIRETDIQVITANLTPDSNRHTVQTSTRLENPEL